MCYGNAERKWWWKLIKGGGRLTAPFDGIGFGLVGHLAEVVTNLAEVGVEDPEWAVREKGGQWDFSGSLSRRPRVLVRA